MSEAKPVAIKIPVGGEKITISNGKLHVPDQPIIPFIEGDGTGRGHMAGERAGVRCCGRKRPMAAAQEFTGWRCLPARRPNKALQHLWLPDETVTACRDYLISIKGPLTTPVGGGIRSLNVALRQTAGSLRLSAAGALVQRRALPLQNAGEGGHGDLPREHGGHLCRN